MNTNKTDQKGSIAASFELSLFFLGPFRAFLFLATGQADLN